MSEVRQDQKKENNDTTKEINKELQPTIEERLELVDKIVADLEDNDISIEESYQLYEQGVKELKQCMTSISLVEKKMLQLTAEGEFEEY